MENNNNKKIIIVVVAAIILAIAGFWFYIKQSSGPVIIKSPVLAHVGNISLTEKDIAYKFAVEKVYGNESMTGDDALQALVRETTEQEVAKAFNVLPMKIDIANFEDHVNKTSKAPELLAAIKNVFGTDTTSYDRIYILPKIVNPMLHTFFSNNKEMNKESSDKIEKALTEVNAGGNFADVAKNNGLQYSTSTVSAMPQGLPPAMQKYFSNKDMPKSKMLTLVETLKSGEINKIVIEDDYAYSLVRLISSEKDVYKIESIVSLKRDYDTWYTAEAKKIPVEFVK